MRLSEAEYEIMQIIWKKSGPITSADLCELSESRGWKAPTVLTFLKRLCQKGLLASEKQGKTRVYYPIVSRTQYAQSETQALIDTLYNGNANSLIACLAAQKGLDEKETAELNRLLDGEWK